MRQVININEKWAFTKDADEIPKEMPKRWCWVHLPHTWNNIDGRMETMIIIAEQDIMLRQLRKQSCHRQINIFWKF